MDRLPDRSLLLPVLDASIHLDSAIAGHIQELDPRRRELVIITHRGLAPAFLEHLATARAGDGTAGGQVLEEHRRILIRDTHSDTAYAPHVSVADSAGFRAVLSVPLLALVNRLVGALSTHYEQPYQPSAASLHRFDNLARVGAQILFCAQIRQHVEGTSAVLALPSRAIHAALICRELLATLAERKEADEVIAHADTQLTVLLNELGRIQRVREWMRLN